MSGELRIQLHTTETPATKPARLAAVQHIADLSDRRLAFFHWREANEALDDIQHKVRDYGDEDSAFEAHDARDIDEAVDVIIAHLEHVRAIARESGERTIAEIRRLAAETAANAEKGGAK